jgi:LemA protein
MQAAGVTMVNWFLVIVLVLIALLVIMAISYYNTFVRASNRVDNSWAQIDVQLKRRTDLIPNLLETVKGYAKHEREVLDSVTRARSALLSAKSPQQAMDADNMLTGALKSLFAVAEAYPDLKANQNFLQLQDELTHTENKVSFARQFFNDAVLAYNNAIQAFPGLIFAGIFGRKTKEMLSIPEAERAVPKVSFS